MSEQNPEPWLRGTLTEVEPVRRAVLHALQLAGEDADRWAAELSDREMFARPFACADAMAGSVESPGLPPVAFQLRHMVRSLDRLLTYAEGGRLSEQQRSALASEMNAQGSAAEVMAEFRRELERATTRVLAFAPEQFAEARGVGRMMLPTTVAGLLIHCAEHTQRHVGQMVTTVKAMQATETELPRKRGRPRLWQR